MSAAFAFSSHPARFCYSFGMSWLASLISALTLFLSSLFGVHAPALPPHTMFVRAGEDYSLYLVANEASSSGQYLLVDPDTGAQTLLGAPFAASSADLSGFYTQSVSHVLDEYGAYVAFDTGTSVERSYTVYAISDGREVAHLCAQHEPLFWHDVIVYLACDHSNLNTAFEGGAPDIASADLLTGATSTLAASHRPDGARFSYRIIGLTGSLLAYKEAPLRRDARGIWDLASSTPTEKTIDLSAQLR